MNDLIDRKARYRQRLIEDKSALLSTVSLLLLIGFVIMSIYMVCIFTIMLSLFLGISIIAFSTEYSVCQDDLPSIAYLPFTLSWLLSLVLMNLSTH